MNKRLKLLTIGLITATSLLSIPIFSVAESAFEGSGNYLVLVGNTPKRQLIINPFDSRQLVTIASDIKFSLLRINRNAVAGNSHSSTRKFVFLDRKESLIIVFEPSEINKKTRVTVRFEKADITQINK